MFKFKKLFSINLSKAGKLSKSASNMFSKAHAKIAQASALLERERLEAIAHAEDLQMQIREAELTIENHKKVQDKLTEFIV